MKRTLRTPSEIQSWLNQFERSSLGVRDFTRRHGLAESTFYKWLREHDADRSSESKVPVIEITGMNLPEPSLCEYIWPNGRRLRFPSSLPSDVLQGWVSVLEEAR